MILVVGGAGYIGSHMLKLLRERGEKHLVLDNFEQGHRGALQGSEAVEGDLRNRADLDRVFRAHPEIDVVMHFAAYISVGESVREPGKYWENNTAGVLNLLEAMREAGVNKFVFSSTAAIFGEPQYVPIDEDHPKEPVNAYGESKLQFERIMAWYRRSFDLRHVSFRYFNACGATNLYGEAREKETHIIPLLFEVAQGKRQQFSLFGTDYPTPDGTCVRDYVHAVDIANAHILALEKIDELGARAYNIGAGTGYTNRQVVEAVREVTGHPIPVVDAPRRIGDPAVLVASADRIREELGWERRFNDLRSMVQSAWDWRLGHPQGYAQ